MTETSGREKVLEEALRDIAATGNLYRAHTIARTALASPSTPEPALRGGKVEEDNPSSRLIERAKMLGEAVADEAESEGCWPAISSSKAAKRDFICRHVFRGVHKIAEIAAALRTHAGESAAQSERAGLERAALADIQAERERQINSEGWSAEHDDDHDRNEMAEAAACYAAGRPVFKAEQFAGTGYEPYTSYQPLWPWADRWWNPKDRRRDLIRAGALIVAEIERLDRAEALSAARKAGGE